MMVIRRYNLQIVPRQVISIPFNSELLGFGMHTKFPALWFLVDTEQRNQSRTFVIVPEEKDLEGGNHNKTRYIGRFDERAEVGQVTLHVFED